MLPSPVPADPGWDEDLTWLDRDPVTAAEFEASLDRLCELDEGPGEDEDEACYPPLTAGELAGIREAAADELLAVKAATTGRRGPGQAGSARVFPGESCSRAAAFGPRRRAASPGCRRRSWSGWCAGGTGSRRTRTPASWPRSASWPGGTRASWMRSSPRTSWRARWGSPGPGRTA